MIATLVGILLGLIISLVIFRRQLSDAVLGLIRRKMPASTQPKSAKTPVQPPRASDEAPITGVKNAFDTAEAGLAFETQQDETEALPICNPAENTYIVETGHPDDTVQGEAPDFDPGTLENFDTTQQDSDDEMLAQLFGEDGESDSEIFDPTGNIAVDDADDTAEIFSEPTAEMPQQADDQLFDPTHELPSEFDGDMFDPTAEIPTGMAAELSSDTADAPVDIDELFAAGNDLLDEYIDDSALVEMEDDPTVKSEMSDLPVDDEEAMAQTLQEALTLLERDFEDEFTASQILESSEIKRSLNKEQAREAEDRDLPEQEVND